VTTGASPADAGCHQPVIELADVSFAYERRPIIEHLNFVVRERDFALLTGPNGAGKTTLLKLIVGLLEPDGGEIRLFGEPARRFRRRERIGYVPQKNAFNPLFPATVGEVVLSGLYGRHRLFRRLTKEDYRKAEDAMHALGIADLAGKRIGMLSGGQQQRVFLARALVNNPSLLILDEPTVGIDAETQEGFYHLIRHMHRQHNITFLMVSHDRDRLGDYLEGEPAAVAGRLKFYVRHSHDLTDCGETDLTHGLRADRREAEEPALVR
jgi:zinc transport system ATP-binding protein